MAIDWGLPLGVVSDALAVSGRYIDLAKIAVGTARLYPESVLREKLAVYEAFDVGAFVGGQFGEYVFATQGMAAMPRFYAEAARLGFRAIEVSDNTVEITLDERCTLIAQAAAEGLEVHGEVGSKDETQTVESLIAHAEASLQAGCDVVLIEAAELFNGSTPRRDLLAAIQSRLDSGSVMFELPGSWIDGITDDQIQIVKRFLMREIGPTVNLANVGLLDVMETQALRCGLSVVGPGAVDGPESADG